MLMLWYDDDDDDADIDVLHHCESDRQIMGIARNAHPMSCRDPKGPRNNE